jgi:hypothetical protein
VGAAGGVANQFTGDGLTAVGDTVHVAARREELTLRHRSTPLAIRVITDARRLAASVV